MLIKNDETLFLAFKASPDKLQQARHQKALLQDLLGFSHDVLLNNMLYMLCLLVVNLYKRPVILGIGCNLDRPWPFAARGNEVLQTTFGELGWQVQHTPSLVISLFIPRFHFPGHTVQGLYNHCEEMIHFSQTFLLKGQTQILLQLLARLLSKFSLEVIRSD